ncbi:Hypothetical predicted protein, partial [Marmota monax]
METGLDRRPGRGMQSGDRTRALPTGRQVARPLHAPVPRPRRPGALGDSARSAADRPRRPRARRPALPASALPPRRQPTARTMRGQRWQLTSHTLSGQPDCPAGARGIVGVMTPDAARGQPTCQRPSREHRARRARSAAVERLLHVAVRPLIAGCASAVAARPLPRRPAPPGSRRPRSCSARAAAHGAAPRAPRPRPARPRAPRRPRAPPPCPGARSRARARLPAPRALRTRRALAIGRPRARGLSERPGRGLARAPA